MSKFSNKNYNIGGSFNKTHIDKGVLDLFMDKYKIKSMLDIGCGTGGMVKLALSKGINAIGVEGDGSLDFETNNIILFNFVKSEFKLNTKFDLGWSVEFVEHVKEEYIKNYMSAFNRCKFVLITFSEKEEKYHINLQNSKYWKNKFEEYKFKFLPETTKLVKENSTMERDFIRKNGLVFRNEKRQ